MEFHRIALLVFVTIMLPVFVSARVVNISNTWMLPEEGFPVFYRYFRDRISWYEADAVCQFHHANLVTADTTSQYDAIRAYLKELDITENIWIGLSKTTERPNFIWTNFLPLNGDGHWQQPIPKGNDPLCVSMDPAADFLWKPMACGGPEIASFICELPVPGWAMGPTGCLLTELPSLTVLYIPEQLALELTSDCGLDGTKRISCKGDADREDILKQLSCAISPDDFDEKSTKLPVTSNTISSTLSDILTEDLSFSSKTTKPWIWTSNTIDIDYGMPTRHRRETEDTLSPASTRSTTDLSTQESQNKNKLTTTISKSMYDTETTSISPERDLTLDMSISLGSDKSMELKTTQVTDLTTQDVNTQPDEQAETSGSLTATIKPKALDSEIEDSREYPGAIGQGQLFSIIENGTMFDIIEVNDTSEDLKLAKEIVMETPQSESETFKTTPLVSASADSSDTLYTTVVYHKEPPSETSFVTNKSIKKIDKDFKKHITKDKNSKKLSSQITDKTNPNNLEYNLNNKMMSKEVEMFPVATDSLIKLNRTHRKELPINDANTIEGNSSKDSSILKVSNISDVTSDKHQRVEIKWHEGENTNLRQMKLFVTTKRVEALRKPTIKPNMEFLNSTEDDKETYHRIDSKLDLLNNDNNITENKESEIFAHIKPEKIISEESLLTRKQFFPLLGETKIKVGATNAHSLPSEPLEPEPQVQPRPNRQRQLTRPQRRSFYPYFFSRVLG